MLLVVLRIVHLCSLRGLLLDVADFHFLQTLKADHAQLLTLIDPLVALVNVEGYYLVLILLIYFFLR